MLEEDRNILYKSYKECKDYEKIRYQVLYAVSRNIEDCKQLDLIEVAMTKINTRRTLSSFPIGVAGSNPVMPVTALGLDQFSKSAYVKALGNIGKK